MAELKAVFLNCTLKKSPEVSNTEALCRMVIEWFDRMDVESEIVRVVDHDMKVGVPSDEGTGDEWPLVLAKIEAADIIVMASSIWFGVRSSVCQMVIERLNGTYDERSEQGQYPLCNKVAGCVVTGNEDGARDAAADTLFNMMHLGCTVPPRVATFWVGEAGSGQSFIEAGGQNDPYTQRTARWTAHNLVHVARILRANPIPAEGNTSDGETEHPPHIR